jgi:molecular chaperone DnaK
MYKASAASAQSEPVDSTAGAAQEPKKDEGVIDAEYVDVDEKK